MRVAFLVGNDLTSHLIVGQLLDDVVRAGHTPYVCYTHQRPDPAAEPELRELFTYERTLLGAYVHPYLDSLPAPLHGALLSPAGIAKLYREKAVVRVVEDVNAPDFIAYLAAQDVRAAFSVRCYQKFRAPLIDHFRPEPGAPALFANLHPGILPAYRGVLTFARSMLHGEREAGFTLHRVNEEWDAGGIVSVVTAPLDYGRSVLENMAGQRGTAAALVRDAIETAAADGNWTDRPQDLDQAGYYSHLRRADLDELHRKGIELCRPRAVIDLLTGAYTPPGSPERLELGGILTGVTSRRPDTAGVPA
ncbi:formyltransferase family protein [Streptomyces sp. NBC_00820]|uniref:formyltransferase family protein n=1 Tax=Streptomyces sp. NBC_00820 TaxID=2975842 RepID=UPI002ED6B337|nr:formyltransferase family protein [Streptomyces sp. NBC_00820]